jgi:hypothetical protein
MFRVTSSVRIQTNVSSRKLRLIGSVVGGTCCVSFAFSCFCFLLSFVPWRERFG